MSSEQMIASNNTSVFYAAFIKRQRFEQLIFNEYSTDVQYGGDTKVNLFIDVQSMICTYLDRGDINPEEDDPTLISMVLNTAAYYKALLNNRPLCVATNIFLVYSTNDPTYYDSCIYMHKSSYMKRKAAKKKWEDKTMDSLNKLCRYIPNLKFVMGDALTRDLVTSLISYNMENGNKYSNIILTKDPLLYSIPMITPVKTTVIRPRKEFDRTREDNTVDLSFSINKLGSNLLSAFAYHRKGRITTEAYNQMLRVARTLDPSFYPVLIPLAGEPLLHGIKASYPSIGSAISNIDYIVNSAKLHPNKFNPANASSFIDALRMIDKERYFPYLKDMVAYCDPITGYSAITNSGKGITHLQPDLKNDQFLYSLNTNLPQDKQIEFDTLLQ